MGPGDHSGVPSVVVSWHIHNQKLNKYILVAEHHLKIAGNYQNGCFTAFSVIGSIL